MEGGPLEEVVAVACRPACRGLAAYDGEVASRLRLADAGRIGGEGAGREISQRSRNVGRSSRLVDRPRGYVSDGKGGG